MNDNQNITLNPQAQDLLFQYFHPMSEIFREVIGLLEIDYVGIALLNPQQELLFFSSKPNIEWMIIEENAWLTDFRFQYDFFMKENVHYWDDTYRKRQGYTGLSISSEFRGYPVVYTFGSESNDREVYNSMMSNLCELKHIGVFCLKRIFEQLPMLFNPSKPHLRLVIDNEPNE